MFSYVKNVINELPRGKGSWKKRAESDITQVVIHQALGAKATTESMNRYHTASKARGIAYGRGWPKIAYHFVVERDGTVKQCNSLTDITYHTGRGANTGGIGICVCGHFEGEGHLKDDPVPAYRFNEPTKEQLLALGRLVVDLIVYLNLDIRSGLKGHFSYGKLACPGFILEQWVKDKRGW